MASKIKSVSDVVRAIPDGSHIALGGFAIARNVMTVVHELIRQQKKNLTLSQCVMGMDTDLLVGAGLVSRLIVGGGSLDRFGLVNCVNRARETGAVVSLDYSSLSVCFMYLAGALGLSFIPIKSLLASEVLERLERGPGADTLRRMHCPFTGEEYLLLRALTLYYLVTKGLISVSCRQRSSCSFFDQLWRERSGCEGVPAPCGKNVGSTQVNGVYTCHCREAIMEIPVQTGGPD